MIDLYKEWLIDVTHEQEPYCFVPYERETDQVVFGLNLITDKSPGSLVGVIHSGGQEKVEEWIKSNPDWQKLYAPPDTRDTKEDK